MNNVLYMTREYGDGKELVVTTIAVINGLQATIVSVIKNDKKGPLKPHTKLETKTSHHKIALEPTELYYDMITEKYFESMPSVIKLMSNAMSKICRKHKIPYRMEQTVAKPGDGMECTIITY